MLYVLIATQFRLPMYSRASMSSHKHLQMEDELEGKVTQRAENLLEDVLKIEEMFFSVIPRLSADTEQTSHRPGQLSQGQSNSAMALKHAMADTLRYRQKQYQKCEPWAGIACETVAQVLEHSPFKLLDVPLCPARWQIFRKGRLKGLNVDLDTESEFLSWGLNHYDHVTLANPQERRNFLVVSLTSYATILE